MTEFKKDAPPAAVEDVRVHAAGYVGRVDALRLRERHGVLVVAIQRAESSAQGFSLFWIGSDFVFQSPLSFHSGAAALRSSQ